MSQRYTELFLQYILYYASATTEQEILIMHAPFSHITGSIRSSLCAAFTGKLWFVKLKTNTLAHLTLILSVFR